MPAVNWNRYLCLQVLILSDENSYMSFQFRNFNHMYNLKKLKLSRYALKYRNASIDIHNVLLHFTRENPIDFIYRIWAVSQPLDTVEHITKLKSISPWVSAPVLSIDFWRITQWSATTKAASSPVESAAYVPKPKQSTGIKDLFHWRFCIQKYKLWHFLLFYW